MKIMNFSLVILFIALLSCGRQEQKSTPDNNMNDKSASNQPGNTGSQPGSTARQPGIAYAKPRTLSYEILRTMDHDTKAFTQGLEYFKGYLYESTGLNGSSSLRKLDAITGKVLKKVSVPGEYFAEGITIFKKKIYQLTWISHVCLVYDFNTFDQVGTFDYQGEGWGMTDDGENLIMSDGSNLIKYLNPDNFQVERTLAVTDESSVPVTNLNELDYINGEIWANVWQTDKIVVINPSSGLVTAWLDMSELKNQLTMTPGTDVLNGIAYDKEKDQYFITGKNWNKIFVLKIRN
jgi:glutaminyl-peptide cyclotransferase